MAQTTCRLLIADNYTFCCYLAFNMDGKTLASGSSDGIALLWDIAVDNVD